MKKFGMNAIDEMNVAAKTVLVRADMDRLIEDVQSTDANNVWIKEHLSMIRKLVNKGAKVVMLVCQSDAAEYEKNRSLRPLAQILERTLGMKVKLVPDICGAEAQYAIRELWPGDVLLLDNMRFMMGDQAEMFAVHTLEPLVDSYVQLKL